jgi:hypothetical protein
MGGATWALSTEVRRARCGDDLLPTWRVRSLNTQALSGQVEIRRARPNAARWKPRAPTTLTGLNPQRRQGLTMRDRVLVRSVFRLWLA